MKKIKVFMFFIKTSLYLKLDSFNINNPIFKDDEDTELVLYAFTFNKLDAKEFKDMRNMDLFIYKEKTVELEDMIELKERYTLCKLIDLSEEDNDCDVGLLVTKEEYLTMRTIAHRKITSLTWDFSDYPDVIKPKYNNALNILKYNIFASNDSSNYIVNHTLKIDYLSIFVMMFNKLMEVV